MAYGLVWPLETLKNLAQAGVPHPSASFAERLTFIGGCRGLYRGVAPGVLCGGLRNGCAMLAMNGVANPLVTRLGLRAERTAAQDRVPNQSRSASHEGSSTHGSRTGR